MAKWYETVIKYRCKICGKTFEDISNHEAFAHVDDWKQANMKPCAACGKRVEEVINCSLHHQPECVRCYNTKLEDLPHFGGKKQ